MSHVLASRPLSRRRFLRVCGAALAAAGLPLAARAAPWKALDDLAEPPLLFRAGFDLGPTPDLAQTEGVEALGARCWRVRGAGGQAFVAYPGSVLRYPTAGNLPAARGSLSLAVKLLEGYSGRGSRPFFRAVQEDTGAGIAVELMNPAVDMQLEARLLNAHGAGAYLRAPAPWNWSIGSWHQIVLTWDVGVGLAALYLDGALAAQQGMRGAPGPLPDSFQVGAQGEYLAGFAQLDDLHLYSGALRPDLVAAGWNEFNAAARREDTVSWSPGVPNGLSLALVPPAAQTFVILSDTHMAQPGVEMEYSHAWRVPPLLEQINSLAPDFVVNCGDMATYWPQHPDFDVSAVEAVRWHSQLRAPVHYVPGNHDVGNKPSAEAFLPGYSLSSETIAAYRRHYGPNYFAFTHGECRGIVVDSQLLNAEIKEAIEQWRWLEEELGKAGAPPHTFLFLHLPLYWAEPDDPWRNHYEIVDEPGRSRLLELARRHGAEVIFSGHTHHPITQYWNEMALVTVGSTMCGRTFADHYGVLPEAVFYDEWRLNYALARVYADRCVIQPVEVFPHAYPARPLQGDAAELLRRPITRAALEIPDGLFGLVANEAPAIRYGMWHSSYATDGELGTGREGVPWHGWASGDLATATDDVWIAVHLDRIETLSRVELGLRPAGHRFPEGFVIELSEDGQQWTPVVVQNRYVPLSDLIRFDFPPRPAGHVRLRSTRLQPSGNPPYRMSIMELRALNVAGENVALGCRCTAQSEADPRVSVDDLGWQCAARLGAKRLRLASAGLDWPRVEARPGIYRLSPSQERAFGPGRPLGVGLILPISTQPPAHAAADPPAACAAYVSYLAQRLGDVAAGWELAYAGQPPADFRALAQAVRPAVGQSPLAAGVFEAQDEDVLRALDGLVDVVVLRLRVADEEDDLEGAIAECRRLAGLAGAACEPWLLVELAGIDQLGGDRIARRLIRTYLASQSVGVRWFWGHASGAPGGLLDGMADPTEAFYAAQVLASVLDAGYVPADVPLAARGAPAGLCIQAFAAEGCLAVACWRAGVEPASVDLILPGRYASPLGVDLLAGAVQPLQSEREGENVILPGIRLRRWPILVTFADKGPPRARLPLGLRGYSS